MTLFLGNNSGAVVILILFLIVESTLYSYKCGVQLQIRKYQKEYEKVIHDEEQKNEIAKSNFI